MRISDWSSDVCSSDLRRKLDDAASRYLARTLPQAYINHCACDDDVVRTDLVLNRLSRLCIRYRWQDCQANRLDSDPTAHGSNSLTQSHYKNPRSEEHTSELQSLMRISYTVFCLTNKTRSLRSHEGSHYCRR